MDAPLAKPVPVEDATAHAAVLAWLAVGPAARTPTENMMMWMSAYAVPCGQLCCFSDKCGSIECAWCFSRLTSRPLRPRYICLGCPLARDEEPADWCAACLADTTLLHEHDLFLCIDERGAHTPVRRPVPIARAVPLRLHHLPTLPLDPAHTECDICCDLFTEENPPSTVPGCPGHGGVRPYVCTACLLRMLTDTYHAPCFYVPIAGADVAEPDRLPSSYAPCRTCTQTRRQSVLRADLTQGVNAALRAWEAAAATEARAAWRAASEAAVTTLLVQPLQLEEGTTPSPAALLQALRVALRTLHPQSDVRKLVDEVIHDAHRV